MNRRSPGASQAQALECRRLLAEIALDPTYGSDGVAVGTHAIIQLVGVQRNGNLVSMVPVGMQGDGQFLINDSKGKVAGRTSDNISVTDARGVIDAQDRIVSASAEPTSAPTLLVVRRYTADGTRDADYGSTLSITDVGSVRIDNFTVDAVATDSAGRLVVLVNGGFGRRPSDGLLRRALLLYRFDTNGQLDTSFGDNGLALVASSDALTGQLAIRAGDRPVVLGKATRAVLLGFTASGQIDPAFGAGGTLVIDRSVGQEALTADRRGRIILFYQRIFSVTSEIARLTAEGRVDTKFGSSGFTTVPDTGDSHGLGRDVHSISVGGGGRIIGAADTLVFRLTADGALDHAFDDDGLVETNISTSPVATDTGIAIMQGGGVRMLTARASVGFGTTTLTLSGTDAADAYVVQRIDRTLRVTFNGQSFEAPDSQITKLVADLGAGNDTLDLRVDLVTSVLGGEGNDTILTAGGRDRIEAGLGDDFVNAGGDADIINDPGGDNTVNGGEGNDSIKSGDGADSILGGLGKDTIRAAGGNDFIDGGGGQDQLHGLAGNDTIWGGGNNDRLFGGPGADHLIGNAGDDFVIDRGDALDAISIDTIDGGSGVDRAYIDEDDDAVSVESLLSAL